MSVIKEARLKLLLATKTKICDNGCLIWTGGKAGKGYPVVGTTVGSRSDGSRRIVTEYIHRLVLELKLGRLLGSGMESCHTCDTPLCVNPDHLFEGTSSDNKLDQSAKGRNIMQVHPECLSGAKNGNAKLSEIEVELIREAYATGRWKQVELAAFFGVAQTTISGFVTSRTYRRG